MQAVAVPLRAGWICHPRAAAVPAACNPADPVHTILLAPVHLMRPVGSWPGALPQPILLFTS